MKHDIFQPEIHFCDRKKIKTRPVALESRYKLYQPERKLNKAIQTSLNLEGESQGEICPYQKILSP